MVKGKISVTLLLSHFHDLYKEKKLIKYGARIDIQYDTQRKQMKLKLFLIISLLKMKEKQSQLPKRDF